MIGIGAILLAALGPRLADPVQSHLQPSRVPLGPYARLLREPCVSSIYYFVDRKGQAMSRLAFRFLNENLSKDFRIAKDCMRVQGGWRVHDKNPRPDGVADKYVMRIYHRRGANGLEVITLGAPTTNYQLIFDYRKPMDPKTAKQFIKKNGSKYSEMKEMEFKLK